MCPGMATSAERARELAARGGLGIAKAIAGRLGQHVTPANFHSTIPELPPPGDPIWSRRQDLPVDTAGQMDFVEDELAAGLAELPDAMDRFRRHGFELWNGLYQGADAGLLYALVRALGPNRVLELGSGFSSMITAAACARNREEGRPADLVCVDPQPRTKITDALTGIGSFERRDARELPLDRFTALEAGDILFIDTSHIVKLGSEVNLLVLEVLPKLAPGVWVHVHDLFLPYEYPRDLLVASGFFNEQYLVQALLTGNPGWEVRLAVFALFREQRKRLVAAMPWIDRQTTEAVRPPSAFWMLSRGGEAAES